MHRPTATRALSSFVACLLAVASLLPLVLRASADGALEPIAARVRAHATDDALALLLALPEARRAELDVRYLRARLLEQKGRYAQALAALPEAAAGLPPAVALDLALRRAHWLARAGECAQALPLLSALLPQARASELPLRGAQCALAVGDIVAAHGFLAALPEHAGHGFAARLLRAQLARLQGDRGAALRELRQIGLRFPAHPRAEEARALARELGDTTAFTADERLVRAQNLLQARNHEAALAELGQLPARKGTRPSARELHLRGMALFGLRTRYAEAAKVLGLAARLPSETQIDDAYHAARALARADRDAQAVKAYRAFAKRYPTSPLALTALRHAAWLALRHGLPGGEATMTQVLQQVEPLGDVDALQDALWPLAFHHFDRRAYRKALQWFDRYAATSQLPMVRSRGLYWAGRCAQLLGDRATALSRFRDAYTFEPLHWYALLAGLRLQELGQERPAPWPAAPAALQPPISPLPLPEDVAFYARLGLTDDAAQQLQRVEAELRKSAPPERSLYALSASYHAIGEYARPYRAVERETTDLLRTDPSGPARAAWDVLFPRPFASEVEQAAAAEKLDVDFVYSIMRKESAFDPSVVSSADAVGLMQLIEPTARAMAKALGIAGFWREQLYEPARNIRLGAHYLRVLSDRYHGQLVLVAAGYNAGESRVDAWLARARKRGKEIALDRFVEDIPIDQTRNYVRRVLANVARYAYLRGDRASPLRERTLRR